MSTESRREFLQAGIAGTAAIALSSDAIGDDKPSTGLPMRPLGSTGQKVSIICLGGWHIRSVKEDAEAIKIMHTAIGEGMNFFDNCWDYHDGGSEEIMGKGLAADSGKWRKKIFLMSKVCSREAKEVRKQIEDSLRRLQTDTIDLMQMHEINWDNDPEWVIEKGGLAELLKMQKEGKVRYVGFTGHKSPVIHAKMLPVHKWDTVQMPINVCDYHYRSFIKEILPKLAEKKIAAIGMKSLGGGLLETGGKIVANKVCTVDEAIRFSLSQDIASLVCGIDSMDILKQNIRIAREFKPVVGEELDKLMAKVKEHSGDGRHERFKSTIDFDGPYHRQQHGF